MTKETINNFHRSVMPDQVIDGLNCESGKIYVDCTLGGGGHSELIAQKLIPQGRLISLDVDEEAIKVASKRLEKYENVSIYKSNYVQLPSVLKRENVQKVDGGILMDLGVSFYQLTSNDRGFSFSADSPLDMRMDKNLAITARELVNTLSAEELADIFKNYGEERYSRKIARAIELYRQNKTIETTVELANLVQKEMPGAYKMKIHPATRVFQALRIAVNKELEILEKALNNLLDLTENGCRIVIITFHSLEDRIVKNFFKHWAKECICPIEMIECRCDHTKKLNIITRKPVIPELEEIQMNPASRSSKLRVAERL